MNKEIILHKIKELIQFELEVTLRSAKSAHEAATHEELIAENKYDTKGLEASYLAGAQAHRANQLQIQLDEISKVDSQAYLPDQKIRSGALIQLSPENEDSFYVYLLPSQGGYSVEINGIEIKTITPSSPIGKKLLGKMEGDEFHILIKEKAKSYEIRQVL